MFEPPRTNQFTQGTIFSCAYAEKYEGIPAYGLVMTARCDAAQDKAPIYNFIPVVSLSDWMLKDGAEIIIQRAIGEAHNAKKNIVEQFGLSASLLRTKNDCEIIEAHLQPKAANEKHLKNKLASFIEKSEFVKRAETALSTMNCEDLKIALRESSKIFDSVVKELCSNRLLGFYLLKGMPDLYGTEHNHVALLREIHHIPNSLAKKIVGGIDRDGWVDGSGITTSKCPLFCRDDNYCAPVARLKSPWIEHLMQSWTMLFARIGVDDIDATDVRKSLSSFDLGSL